MSFLSRSRKQSEHTTPPGSKAKSSVRLNNCDFLIAVLECYMSKTIAANEEHERMVSIECLRFGNESPSPSVFHALEAPYISPVEYLKRLARYSFASNSVFLVAFFYLETIATSTNMKLLINSLSVHRLLLTSVLLATKMMDDVLYDNAHFAKVGGLEVKELNMLELDLLKLLDFRLFISCEEFEQFERKVLNTALNSDDPEHVKLKGRLANLGFVNDKLSPPSPTSSMDVSSFSS